MREGAGFASGVVAVALACLMPASAIAAVAGETTLFSALCSEKAANGFLWKSGKWTAHTLRPDRYRVERVEPDRPGCGDALAAKKRFDSELLSIAYGCYSVRPAEVADAASEGDVCKEVWLIQEGVHSLLNVTCNLGLQSIVFEPDGAFHLSSITSDLGSNPKGGDKGALYVSYGTCKVE